MNVVIARQADGLLSPSDLTAMHQLRYQIFRQRLNWEVPTDGEQERDEYDRLVEATYMVVRDEQGQVMGCWRMLPTTGPNMLRDTFPQLLGDTEMPVGEQIWELSRFATRAEKNAQAVNGYNRALPLKMMRALVAFASQQGIQRFVTVTTLPIERMLRCLGVAVARIAAPMQVGIERAVALTIDINAQTVQALAECPQAQSTQMPAVATAQTASVLPLPTRPTADDAANDSPYFDGPTSPKVVPLQPRRRAELVADRPATASQAAQSAQVLPLRRAA